MTPFSAIDEIRRRSTEAILGQTGLNHPGLTAELRARLGASDWRLGGVLQEPVVEAALPYIAAEETLGDLSGGLLHPDLVDALAGDDEPSRAYRFPRHQRPYAHQIEAWTRLRDPSAARSVLVTSGTGSGKTECFLVPILDDLARQAAGARHRLEGVQAIMLYPLNALIASQEERLRAWTSPFAGAIRFALYNGLMPERVKPGEAAMRPESVADRRSLRAAPPPILVTNVTMLEYMLLRPDDAPILRASKGKLRYIVLDEAHSYVGAQAAEIALLLRRVCLAFDVDPADVRFIATSATIGQGEGVERALHDFLADVSGAPPENVHVVTGSPQLPSLPIPNAGGPVPATGHYDYFGGHPQVRPLLEKLYAGATPWSDLRRVAEPLGLGAAELAVGIAHATSDDGEALAPLRVHSFHRAVPGVWSCLDLACHLEKPADWPFGAVHLQPADVCGCGAPLFEIVSCSSCGEVYLDVEEAPDQRLVRPNSRAAVDEFAADADRDSADGDDDDDEDAATGPGDRKLLSFQPLRSGYRWVCVEGATGRVHDREGAPGVHRVAAYDRHKPESCPACALTGREGSDLIRPIRFGAPFILGNATPVLLEGAARPAEASDPERWTIFGGPPPMQGRQLLSFTDSRQGTARLSAKLQIASERNHVRSVVYHAVQDALGKGGDMAKLAEAERGISALRTALAATGPNPDLETFLADEEARRDDLRTLGQGGLPWDEMVSRLAERDEVRVWIKSVWSRRDMRFESPEKLAEFLLLREFIRRPPRANTLETLGLARLRFDAIDRLPDARVPSAWIGIGGSGQDWRDFLHILTTVLVRGRTAVRVSPEVLHWIPPKGINKELVFRPDGPTASYQVAWPRLPVGAVGRLSLVVNLLEQAFGRSLDVPGDRETLQDILDSAWSALTPVLTVPGSTNFQLNFSKAHVAPLVTAWICPITRRLLDVSLRGLTPYGARTRPAPPTPAKQIAMPRHPIPFLGITDSIPKEEAREAVSSWLASDTTIGELRALGAWSDLTDRIAHFSEYFRSAEHSAQQPPAKLRRYEEAFKAGAINVLNCSTTMEMGVDIGSVSHVMMTNLPPSVANYRQRIGRAGRRGQPLSMGFTFCRDRPLDREAFRDPTRYLRRSLRAPKVALGSRVIVQRHVNALLFAAHVQAHGGNAMKMHAGPFFGCMVAVGAKEEVNSAATGMAAWVRRPETQATFLPAIRQLTRNSILAADDGVFEMTAQAVEHARNGFAAEWRAAQELAASCNDDSVARKRLASQLRRLCEDYLLSVLATRGVLPGHGFPTDVVSFVTRDAPSEADKTEENARFNSYPQRALDMAIREYAPGSEVVLDGLVHRSAGVTLNWKRPASIDGVRDVQALKWRWNCAGCGESGTAREFNPDRRDCPACHAANANWSEFLQPAGFAVDLRVDPHADADVVTYVPPEPTAVSAAGEPWESFFDPARGRYRATREGTVFFCNAGPSRQGYAICLSCGRADAPSEPHAPLLGPGPDCEGSYRPYARKEGLKLGHEIVTDVFELQPAAWPQPGGAVALAVAVREALARELGIAADEMGFAAQRRLDALGAQTMSVFLHDKATGGAGFAVQARALFGDILGEVQRILDCKVEGCVQGCPSCVLVSDLSDEEASNLDRQSALELVRDRLAADGAPEPIDCPVPGTRFSTDIVSEVGQLLERGSKNVRLRLSGEVDTAALSDWPAAGLLNNWRNRGVEIAIVVDIGTVEALDGAQRLRLRDFANRMHVSLEEGSAGQFENGANLIAEVVGSDGSAVVFASRDETAASAGSAWGKSTTAPIVRFTSRPTWSGRSVEMERLQPVTGAIVRHVEQDLDGPLADFGERAAVLLDALVREIGIPSGMRITEMEYEDKYLRSPLALRLCLDTLGALASRSAGLTRLSIVTSQLVPRDKVSQWLDDDWKYEEDREVVAGLAAEAVGLELDFRTDGRSHARRLVLQFEDGSRAQLLFDQGFGPWRSGRGSRFDFTAPVTRQVRLLGSIQAALSIVPGTQTFIVAERLQRQ